MKILSDPLFQVELTLEELRMATTGISRLSSQVFPGKEEFYRQLDELLQSLL